MNDTYKTFRPKVRATTFPLFSNSINELFNTAIGDVIGKNKSNRFTNPAVNVLEFDNRFILEVAAPGFTKE